MTSNKQLTTDKIIFLDRDGVINRDSTDYIKSRAEFEFLPGSLEALKFLKLNGFTTIIITNQSAVNRKMIPEEELAAIHALMRDTVSASGGEIRDIFFCPHRPEEGCNCRKPKPGLIYQAQKRYQIDLSTACMVGDSAKDIECARSAGCGCAVLVRTGNGISADKILAEKKIVPDHVADNLYEAVRWLL
ncbi:D-glycero-beta-D-manno-heptose 1,7-bisphosphate 7-phosphatase [Desulfococcaceae bacterium HSG8]|nr:D-glycero-beta-D-manno-heptose 1,7-bisphosphate 7-phosphatase [Desulfococcaceae bacterium HSG8]